MNWKKKKFLNNSKKYKLNYKFKWNKQVKKSLWTYNKKRGA